MYTIIKYGEKMANILKKPHMIKVYKATAGHCHNTSLSLPLTYLRRHHFNSENSCIITVLQCIYCRALNNCNRKWPKGNKKI